MSGDVIFQKNLQDLVKGIRNNKKDTAAYISQSIADAKIELKNTDPFVKAEAVRKLTYLQAFGYNISWASFAIVEVMSQAKFGHKRIGYLAANQSFNDSTDVILLTTNLFKKEMGNVTSSNHYDIGLAINCLSNIVTNDLAKDCLPDVVRMMNHQKAYVRKKAVLSMYKLYIKYPQGLRLTFEKLKEHLDDSDGSVVSCAVNVVCELSNKNAKNYVSMAQKFFTLLTTSTNNWMLIKLVKLMGSLVPEEPRLARKLLDPLAAIIQSTPAKSIQYECINTITEALLYTKREDGTDAKSVPAVVKLCSNYLRGFVEDSDPNLKYLGLVGLNKLMESHPRSLTEHRDIVLRCLNDQDATIRIKALDLLVGIVSKKTLVDLIHHLLDQVNNHAEGQFRHEVIRQILIMGSKDKFCNVEDFAWYLTVLTRLACIPGSNHGKEVSDQLMEVVVRVESVRPFAVECMLSIILNDSLLTSHAKHIVCEVLKAAAWIVGEYASTLHYIKHDSFTDDEITENEDLGFWIEGALNEDVRSAWRGKDVHALVLETLLHPRATSLPNHVQCTFLQSALKIFIRTCVDEIESDLTVVVGIIRTRLQVFLQSHNMEIQERASTLRHLLSELDILSLNWYANAAIEESKTVTNISDNSFISDSSLLDFGTPTVYTAGSVKIIDDAAARAAISKRAILLAAISEPFYTVHPRAQKKVPKPEDIDMTQSINSSAIKKVLGLELPSTCFAAVSGVPTVTLSNLSFVKRDERSPVYGYDNGDYGSKQSPIGGQSSGTNLYSINQSSSLLSNASNSANPSPINGSHNRSESLFYLSSEGRGSRDSLDQQPHQGVKPLAQIFAIDEDSSKKKSKKSKDKVKERDRGNNGGRFDDRDMLPAGALDSNDEEDKIFADSRRKSSSSRIRNKSKPQGKVFEEDDVLGNIDITTPLEDHEVLVDRKHREVASSSSSSNPTFFKLDESNNTNYDDREKSKKKKKAKESKKMDFLDLLNFEANTSVNNELSNQQTIADEGGSSQVLSPSSSIKTNSVWLSMIHDERFEILYSVASGSNGSLINNNDDDLNLKILIKVINYSKTTLTVDLSLDRNYPNLLRSSTLYSTKSSSKSVNLCTSLPNLTSGHNSNITSWDVAAPLDALNMHFGGNSDIDLTGSCRVTFHEHGQQGLLIAVDNSNSSSSLTMNCVMKIHECFTFNPSLDMTPDGLESILMKSSNNCGVAKVVLPLSLKWKSAVKIIASFINGAIVDNNTKAMNASIYSKTSLSEHICILVKSTSSHGSSGSPGVKIEVKCMRSSKQDSQITADNIIRALQTSLTL